MRTRSGGARRFAHEERYARADRVRERHVTDDAVAEEGIRAMARAVDELVGEDDVRGVIVLLHRADRARGEDRMHAEFLEGEDVGAVVHFGGIEAVASPVSRQKGHADAVHVADHERIGGRAERGLDHSLLDDVEALHRIQAGAADDADWNVHSRPQSVMP